MYNVKWRISFKSKSGVLYHVNIYDSSYSGSIIPLTGGSRPFVTQEDDTDDVFTPIRTQSGYIRIVDDGKDANGNVFNWRDLIPVDAMSRPVTLTHSTTVDWCGFMQPQTFSGGLHERVQEREFPVHCLLSNLSAYEVEPTNQGHQLANFGYLISYAFSPLYNVFGNLTFRFHGGDDVDSWLLKRVLWSNFSDKDEDGRLSSKYDSMEMLEEVCKFFGWTARVSGMTVSFESVGSGMNWREIGYIGLLNLSEGLSYTAVTLSPTTYSGIPGSYASTRNNLTIMRGWRKSTVTADVGKLSTIVEYPTSEIYKILVPEWRESVTRKGTYWQQYYVNDGPINDLPDYNCEEVVVSFMHGTTTIYGSSVVYNGFPFIWSEYYDGSEPAPRNVSMLQGAALEHSAAQNPDSSHYLMRMKTKNSYWLQDGILVISGKVYNYRNNIDSEPNTMFNGHGTLYCSLKIGDKYAYITYDSSQVRHTVWRTAFSTFPVGTGADGQGTTEEIEGQGQILSTRMWNDPYPSYDGYAVPIEGSIGGDVEFCIHEFHDPNPPAGSSENQRPVYLMDLKLEFYRKTDSNLGNASEDSQNKYVVKGDSSFSDEKSVDLHFATDNNNSFGRSIVCNPDGTYCRSIVIGGSDVRPEQRLVNRMASFGRRVHDILDVETDGTGNASALCPQSLMTYMGKTFAPVSISHEWRDDKYGVRYVEIDS